MTRAEKIIRFIETACRVPEGALVGQPVKLAPFQVDFIRAVFDNPNGTRRCYLSMARKQGKTALAACILLAFIAGPERIKNAQIVSAARSRDQASLLFSLMRKMIELNPELARRTRVYPSQKRIIGIEHNVEYTAISADAATNHGRSPLVVLLDEVGQVRGQQDDFIASLETSQGAHASPLLMAISTQAAQAGDLFSIWLDDAVNNPSPHVVSHLHAADEGCDILDEAQWLKANPALDLFSSRDFIREQALAASRMRSKENDFRWLHLNQRVTPLSGFISKGEWDACYEEFSISEIPEGALCYAGLDLALTRDMSALVLAFPQEDGTVRVWPIYWIPGGDAGLRERERAERVPYSAWQAEGLIRVFPGPVSDHAAIARDIAELTEVFDVRGIAFDRWQSHVLRRELDAIGCGVELVPHGQGFRSMTEALALTENAIAERRLRHAAHPVLAFNFASATVETDAAGGRKLSKKRSTAKIDGAVATCMAMTLVAGAADLAPRSYLEEPGSSLMFLDW